MIKMKIKSLFLFFVVIAANSFGQKNFEPGYFIGNDNQRVECLIKTSNSLIRQEGLTINPARTELHNQRR